MRVVHTKIKSSGETLPATYRACIEMAATLEKSDELDEAIKVYQKCIQLKKADEYAYSRLMILYRKKKAYQKELAIIREAITAFEKLYNPVSTKNGNQFIRKISNAILKSTGLSDKKGKTVFKPQPILRWQKRALLLQKRVKK